MATSVALDVLKSNQMIKAAAVREEKSIRVSWKDQ